MTKGEGSLLFSEKRLLLLFHVDPLPADEILDAAGNAFYQAQPVGPSATVDEVRPEGCNTLYAFKIGEAARSLLSVLFDIVLEVFQEGVGLAVLCPLGVVLPFPPPEELTAAGIDNRP